MKTCKRSYYCLYYSCTKSLQWQEGAISWRPQRKLYLQWKLWDKEQLVVGFISSYSGMLTQENNILFCSIFPIKTSFQLMTPETLLQYLKHKNHHFYTWEKHYRKKHCSSLFWDRKIFEFKLLQYIFSNNSK